jgi:hypothetical protein
MHDWPRGRSGSAFASHAGRAMRETAPTTTTPTCHMIVHRRGKQKSPSFGDTSDPADALRFVVTHLLDRAYFLTRCGREHERDTEPVSLRRHGDRDRAPLGRLAAARLPGVRQGPTTSRRAWTHPRGADRSVRLARQRDPRSAPTATFQCRRHNLTRDSGNVPNVTPQPIMIAGPSRPRSPRERDGRTWRCEVRHTRAILG